MRWTLPAFEECLWKTCNFIAKPLMAAVKKKKKKETLKSLLHKPQTFRGPSQTARKLLGWLACSTRNVPRVPAPPPPRKGGLKAAGLAVAGSRYVPVFLVNKRGDHCRCYCCCSPEAQHGGVTLGTTRASTSGGAGSRRDAVMWLS